MTEAKTKILVVDDDDRLRDLHNRYLTEQGFTVRAVADATDMNRQLARERYDLMILDLMLPGEDGLSICRRLRAANVPPAACALDIEPMPSLQGSSGIL
jgi:two-component system phosphate regulon response regulator OmpR